MTNNKELLLNKTIERVEYDEYGEQDKIVLFFTDGTSSVITTDASNIMYSLYIEENKKTKKNTFE